MDPARGFASIGNVWYCHVGPSPTCYERAVALTDGGVPAEALAAMDAIWRESLDRNIGFFAHGTRHTAYGLDRRRQRDRVRQRARLAVRDLHRADFEWIKSQVSGTDAAAYASALRRLAARHPDEYNAAYAKSLAEQGYQGESHPCSSLSTATTIGAENECCSAVGTDRAAFPNPVEGSEMDERTHAVAVGEVR